ncbi:hypothetical protein PbJCM13498_38920 [Prolixibacter bellariivorans]|uniref:Uncharacterized protein n=1 Tax=Prolixibacter bellariivorans TaxID=314319 RepID=A0A5M4B4D2_9BACT|nr:hypothetical protein [Prolixibacter bellariivorans]GET35029.1 hypothetical protein PbJCM13498_38920 [Prolixibacter bellariivorans]
MMLGSEIKIGKVLLFSSIVAIPFFQTSCSKNSSPTSYGEDNYGEIKFTARGEDVTCVSDQNEAVFEYKPGTEKHNSLTLQGMNEDVPQGHENMIVLEMITDGDLHEGTYPMIDYGVLLDCQSGTHTDNCDKVASGVVTANFDSGDPLWGTKDVRSSGGGTLTLQKIEIGTHHDGQADGETGYTEARVSGSFSFPGTNLNGDSSGKAEGTFKDIPLRIYDKN